LRAQMVRVSHIEEVVQCIRTYGERLRGHDSRTISTASLFS
jgi:hypothetical protein